MARRWQQSCPNSAAQPSFTQTVIPEQAERSFQILRVRLLGDEKQVSVVNCHAPSSGKRNLTEDRRLSYFNAFHTTTGADSFIWGGDFNTGAATRLSR